jgi:uracil-DNA glycosylase
MKIQNLFTAYKEQVSKTYDIDAIFKESKMVNEYEKLDYGFFPLGSGVLMENKSEAKIAELNPCEIMVLGNDFGHVDYLNICKKENKREKTSNRTIANLQEIGLNIETTFFTNLHLGVRQKGESMMGSMKHEKRYEEFCLDFLDKQLEIAKPKIVLCLGNDVAKLLREKYAHNFPSFPSKSVTKLFANNEQPDFCIEINGIKFIIIPHPCFAHLNWKKNNIKQQIKNAIKLSN